MVALEKVRDLDWVTPLQTGRADFLTAASGLVVVQNRLYVIADDEHHLAVFDWDRQIPGRSIELLPGVLPVHTPKRKRVKPDLEALCQLPAFVDYPHGALFALGSGSLPNRSRGCLAALDFAGQVFGDIRVIDLSALYEGLQAEFSQLNIEGAVVSDSDFCLLQRGGKSGSRNACIRIDLRSVLQSLERSDALGAALKTRVQICDLGELHGLPLCFTDAAALADGQIMFTAIIEDTANNVDDGACTGAAIGILDSQGFVESLRLVEPTAKIEGIAVREMADQWEIALVTDDDDPTRASALYRARWMRD